MFRQMLVRISTVVRQEGLTVAFAKIVSVSRRSIRRRDANDHFDARFNTDTATEVPLWHLNIESKNAKHGSQYQTTDPSVFFDVVKKIPHDIRGLTFIDLGCGKGRTLILAAREGFNCVIGVEFSPELTAIARSNIRQLNVVADVIELDAAQFEFPDDHLLVYMYNPFDRVVMRSVVDNLLQWHKRHSKNAFVAYVNPTCQSIFESCQDFRPVSADRSVRIWQLGPKHTTL